MIGRTDIQPQAATSAWCLSACGGPSGRPSSTGRAADGDAPSVFISSTSERLSLNITYLRGLLDDANSGGGGASQALELHSHFRAEAGVGESSTSGGHDPGGGASGARR